MDPNFYENEHALADDCDQLCDPDSDANRYEIDWCSDFDQQDIPDSEIESELSVPSIEQITQLLSSLSEGTTEPAALLDSHREAAASSSSRNELESSSIPNMDDELRDAFLDDAGQCLAAIETAILRYETDANRAEPLRVIGRELHTLKGASASVGMTELAEFLHQIEDEIGSEEHGSRSNAELPSAEDLLTRLDTIRKAIHVVRAQGTNRSVVDEPQQPAIESVATTLESSPRSFDSSEARPGDEETVRVKSSQLNRLMDMLAELVMLRNRRETELSELQAIYEQLIKSVCRVRSTCDRKFAGTSDSTTDFPSVANELMRTAQELRKCTQPIKEGNATISHFIRQFRQELVELRRTPISGLFSRLQRVVRDAAIFENKQVQLTLLGEDTGIERSLQQRLYEPLLHIVRNCVCHGIESPAERQTAGKNSIGTITLQARSSADLFVIEIRDDGKGLDYDAIRRRGFENGLLKANTSASEEELAQLIFQPGFSTRQSANQVAGRGVGMDVVSETLKRMRGWVAVDSVSGKGTCIRLSFPLPSVIQHTMVFRSSGQLYALPMQFVQKAGARSGCGPALRLEELLNASNPFQSDAQTTDGVLLVLDGHQVEQTQTYQQDRRIHLRVDEIIGPEEVVVRPLPALLKQHPICCGATLSGLGETVLVLDAVRVMKFAVSRMISQKSAPKPSRITPSMSEMAFRPKVLVVDDTRSARLRVVQSLGRYEVDVVEAADGDEALRLLTNQHFSAIFSDLEMPHVNGMELLSKLRHLEDAAPAFIISSRDESSIRDAALSMGAAGYLIKPLVDDELDKAISSIPSLREFARAASREGGRREQPSSRQQLTPVENTDE